MATVASLTLRSRVLRAVREWFWSQDYIEVETPLRLAAPALEDHIDAIPSGRAFLRTSPECHLKRLLAAGAERLFELGPCFRDGERGPRHNPEYTMLEWYRAGGDYHAMLDETRALLRHVVRAVCGGTAFVYAGRRVELDGAWPRDTVSRLFRRAAGWDPVAAYEADRFDLDLVDKVEPQLPRDRPFILIDYPAACAALARLRPDDPRVAERWELYVAGVELANAFGELTDAREQRRRFAACAAGRAAAGKPVYPLDEPFLEALAAGLPDCAGVALGIDRLVMLLADAPDIHAVRAFSAVL